VSKARSAARKWLGRLIYVAFLILVVEIALQGWYYLSSGGFLFSRVAVPIYRTDPYSHWSVQPNLDYHHATTEFSIDVFTNSEGFRTSSAREEYSRSDDPDRFRIMLLGPSFAFGWGVNFEDTFAHLLETRLQDAGFADGRRIEVINRGIPALPASLNLEWYRNLGQQYAPDLVIQFMYGSLMPAPPPTLYADEDGFLRDSRTTGRQRMVARAKKSAIVFYSWLVYTRLRSQTDDAGSSEKIEGAGRELSIHEGFDPGADDVREAMRFYEDLRRTVEASDSRLMIFFFPLSYVVHREDVARWRHLGVRDLDRQIAYNDAFVRYLRDEGYTILNATDALITTAASNGERLYYWLDVHWTPAGNAVAADLAADFLISRRATARAEPGPDDPPEE
jgi:hypothetical protein